MDHWSFEPQPFLEHGLEEWRYEAWGCEDARVTDLPERKGFYVTYTAYSPYGCAVGMARTTDFVQAERVGLILSPSNKDAALFSEKFKDRWAVIHRPDAGGGVENIWIAYSPDLIHWGEPHCVLREGQGAAWDGARVGTGPPPLLTRHGWLLLYHGVKLYAGQSIYRVGAALLDRDTPSTVIARSPDCIFKPMALYEQSGLAPSVVFPTGLLLRGDELWMYYGAADMTICLATAKLQDVLDTLVEVS